MLQVFCIKGQHADSFWFQTTMETIFPLALNRHSVAILVAEIYKYFLLHRLNDYDLHNVVSTTLGDCCLLQDKENECPWCMCIAVGFLNISASRFFLSRGLAGLYCLFLEIIMLFLSFTFLPDFLF